MKLYATTTSERATKGQGGKHIEITLQNEDKDILLRFDTVFHESFPNYKIRVIDGNIDFIKVLKNHLSFFIDQQKQSNIYCQQCFKDTLGSNTLYKQCIDCRNKRQ